MHVAGYNVGLAQNPSSASWYKSNTMIPVALRPTYEAMGVAPVWVNAVWVQGTATVKTDGSINIWGGGLNINFPITTSNGHNSFSLTWTV
jgi:hypothetical protein